MLTQAGASAAASGDITPGPSPNDVIKSLHGLVSQLHNKTQQMAMKSAEDRLVISLLQQQCVTALSERKELARELLTVREQSGHNTDTLKAGAAGLVKVTLPSDSDSDHDSTYSPGTSDDDDDNNDAELLQRRIKELKRTIIKLRSSQSAVSCPHRLCAMTPISTILSYCSSW